MKRRHNVVATKKKVKSKTVVKKSGAKSKAQSQLKKKSKLQSKQKTKKSIKKTPLRAKAATKKVAKKKATQTKNVKKKTAKKKERTLAKKTSVKKNVQRTVAPKKGGVVKKNAPEKNNLTATSKKLSGSLQTLFTPLDDRLVVKLIGKSNKTSGGIYIPDSSVASAQDRGEVLAVGRGHQDKKGRIQPMDVKVGDKILFSEYAASKVNIEDQDLLILREQDVFGIVE